MTQKYSEIYQKSIKNREDFWKEISNDIFWYKKPTKILNSQNPPFYKWFEDGVTNTCYNALDLHVDQGKGEKLAIIYDSPITGSKEKITYNNTCIFSKLIVKNIHFSFRIKELLVYILSFKNCWILLKIIVG